MVNRIRNVRSLIRSQGLRWFFFRAGYAFRKRTGLLRLQMPSYRWDDRPLATWLKGNSRSSQRIGALDTRLPENVPWDPRTAIEEADRLLRGEIKYFSHTFYKIGFPPDWHKDPVSGIKLDPTRHWSEYSDDTDVDIKFIWEPNRFAFVYTLVRAYASSRDEKYSEAFWELIQAWAESNPPNTGANWMDGQEIALRLMAWIFGLCAFMHSPSTTPERKDRYTVFVAAQAERIYKNIGFALSTRSNHAVSEAFGLWMVGLFFPELKDAEKYFACGRQLLEQEAAAQIFPDGTYSMYSLNYHRFILQIYLYAIQLGEKYQLPFTNFLKASITRSIEFLTTLIDPQTGKMPVYGSNDGALVLPLNNCDYTDFRPLLQLGWFITKGERLFDPGPWDEDLFWLCGADFLSQRERAGVREITGLAFPHGGIYLLRNTNSKAVLRCTDFRERPSHADQLHVDLWMRGHNIAIDAGTYLYSGEGIWRNGLACTSVHNTVTVDRKDQMTMVSRFTWTNWSKGKVLRHEKNLWQVEHDGYKPVSHRRTVMALDDDRWLVIDRLADTKPHLYALHWLLADSEYGIQKLASGFGLWLVSESTSKVVNSKLNIQMGLLEGNGNFSLVRADANSTRGWRSRYYGYKEPALSVLLEADQPNVTFWTFFGFEKDVVEKVGKSLRVRSQMINLEEIK